MEARLQDIFRCKRCEFWYLRDEEGPWQECRHCYWGISINRKAVLSVQAIVIMMARELEELLAA